MKRTSSAGKPKRANKFNAAQQLGKRSMLEVNADRMLTEAGLSYDYEPRSYELRPAFNFCFFTGEKGIMKKKCIARNMSYCP
jgi:hypothetical protein